MGTLQIAQTIQQQLMAGGRIKVMSWGAHNWVGGDNFLQFKVQGFLFKGIVRIVLTSMDDYTIEFYKPRTTEPFKTIEGMYCDQLTEVIDRHVEKGDISQKEYENKITNKYGL